MITDIMTTKNMGDVYKNLENSEVGTTTETVPQQTLHKLESCLDVKVVEETASTDPKLPMVWFYVFVAFCGTTTFARNEVLGRCS